MINKYDGLFKLSKTIKRINKQRIIISLFIFLVLLTPFIYSNKLYQGLTSTRQIWFYITMSLLMAAKSLFLLFNRKPITFSFNKIDISLLLFYTYLVIRAITTPYTPLFYNQKLINWTLCIILYFIIKAETISEKTNNVKKETEGITIYPSIFHSFITNILILFGLIQAMWGLLQLYGFLPSFNGNFKITGTFFNPAPYALYLALMFPLALGKIFFSDNNQNIFLLATNKRTSLYSIGTSLSTYLSIATAIAIILVLPATMIRTAWLGAIIGSMVVLQHKYHYLQFMMRILNNSLRRTMVLIFVGLFLALFVTGTYFLKKDSANSKLFIWEVTIGKVVEKPLFGYGFGRFEAKYNDWQAEYFHNNPKDREGYRGVVAGNTKYCFNEYLEMLSELGILGIILFFTLILYVIRNIKKEFRKKNQSGNLILDSSLLLSYLVIAAFSFPFYNIELLLLMLVILGKVSTTNQWKINILSSFKPAVSGILLLAAVGFFYVQFNKITAYKNWQKADFMYKSGYYLGANKLYDSNLQEFRYEGLYMQQYGKSLEMEGKNTQAIDMLTRASNFTSDHVLYCTLGDAYKNEKEFSKAEKAYLFAAEFVPHKLYPHYLLAELYEISGQHLKAKIKANEVLKKSAKIKSIAVEEMKNEMKKIEK